MTVQNLIVTALLAVVGPYARAHASTNPEVTSSAVYFDQSSGGFPSGLNMTNIIHNVANPANWGGVTSSYENYLTVLANHDCESSTADWFNNGLTYGNMVGNRANFGGIPTCLSFAFSGDLSITVDGVNVTCPGFRIGQGQTTYDGTLRYNWWIGSSQCASSGSSTSAGLLACSCGGTKVEFNATMDSSYVFDVSVPCAAAPACMEHDYTFNENDCGAWILWRFVQGSTEVIHQAFGYDNNFRSRGNATIASFSNATAADQQCSGARCPHVSLTPNSGYYCFPDGKQLGPESGGTCGGIFSSGIGRVCSDTSSDYNYVLSNAGLSDHAPNEQNKTCWFIDPTKGASLDCTSLWDAEKAVQATWNQCENPEAPKYQTLLHNCRDYIVAVMTQYCANKKGADPACTC